MPALTKFLEMRVRALAPRQLKTVYRLLRSAVPFRYPPALPPELMRDCRMFPDRAEMLSALPAGGVVAELGTYIGDFARIIDARTSPRELHLVDIDLTPLDRRDLDKPHIAVHRGLTQDVIAGFPDDHFDWIYIDADHSYEGVIRDARASRAKVKPGGYLVFNDFAHIDPSLGRYGVHTAVVEFAIEAGWPFRFIAYHPQGLFDVALQRPA